MIITKKRLPRRTFLRGLGVALAVPFLDSMVPALATAADAIKKATRLTFIYVPNGVMMDFWTPKQEGAGFAFTPTLEPLTPFRNHIRVLSGLAHMEALALTGENGGDHARASSSFLTCVHARKTEGAEILAGVSIDQIAARYLGQYTQLASLELALDATETIGECESGYSCAYTNTLSWRTPTTPVPMEHQPRAVFENLFGDNNSTDAKVRLREIRMDHSILDFVTEGVNGLVKTIGASDRGKINDYLDAIRDVERRIQLAEKQSSRELPVVDRPVGIPATYKEHALLMYDLQVLAYQTDLTRVTTFMTGHEQTNRAYPEIGIPDAHHSLSHHGGNAEKQAKLVQINGYHTKLLAYFLEKLSSTPDGDGSLLDHSIIVYGSGLSDGNMHTHDNLPILLAGGGSGQLKGGRHIRYQDKTPMRNLYGTILGMVGAPSHDLESGAGKVEPLSIA
jgi:Protein of unknown function (DUF1552)